MLFSLFIPTCFSGWKYCLKNPSSFFKSCTMRKVISIRMKNIESQFIDMSKYHNNSLNKVAMTIDIERDNCRLRVENNNLKCEIERIKGNE